MNELIERLKRFFSVELWVLDKNTLPPFLRPLLTPIQALYMILQGFTRKHTILQAAALSYITVLGIIPLFILVFSFSKGFIAERTDQWVPKVIDRTVKSITPYLNAIPITGESEISVRKSTESQLVGQISQLMMKLDAGKLGLFGAIPLLVVAYSMLRTIENSLNDIWGIRRGRPFWQQFLLYWFSITLLPTVILLTIWFTGQYQVSMMFRGLNRSVAFITQIWVYIGPYLILCGAFTIFYKVVPNTSVKFHAAAIGGVVAASLWQLNNILSFMYVSNAIRMQTLYGGIAIIPIFLVALYCAWLIVLFGAHATYAAQNLESVRREFRGAEMESTPAFQQSVAAACLLLNTETFTEGRELLTKAEMADLLYLPENLLEEPLAAMRKIGYLNENIEDPPQYVLCKSPELIKLGDVFNAVIGLGESEAIHAPHNPYWQQINQSQRELRGTSGEQTDPTLAEMLINLKNSKES